MKPEDIEQIEAMVCQYGQFDQDDTKATRNPKILQMLKQMGFSTANNRDFRKDRLYLYLGNTLVHAGYMYDVDYAEMPASELTEERLIDLLAKVAL